MQTGVDRALTSLLWLGTLECMPEGFREDPVHTDWYDGGGEGGRVDVDDAGLDGTELECAGLEDVELEYDELECKLEGGQHVCQFFIPIMADACFGKGQDNGQARGTQRSR